MTSLFHAGHLWRGVADAKFGANMNALKYANKFLAFLLECSLLRLSALRAFLRGT